MATCSVLKHIGCSWCSCIGHWLHKLQQPKYKCSPELTQFSDHPWREAGWGIYRKIAVQKHAVGYVPVPEHTKASASGKNQLRELYPVSTVQESKIGKSDNWVAEGMGCEHTMLMCNDITVITVQVLKWHYTFFLLANSYHRHSVAILTTCNQIWSLSLSPILHAVCTPIPRSSGTGHPHQCFLARWFLDIQQVSFRLLVVHVLRRWQRWSSSLAERARCPKNLNRNDLTPLAASYPLNCPICSVPGIGAKAQSAWRTPFSCILSTSCELRLNYTWGQVC